jgi:hypothetical protein
MDERPFVTVVVVRWVIPKFTSTWINRGLAHADIAEFVLSRHRTTTNRCYRIQLSTEGTNALLLHYHGVNITDGNSMQGMTRVNVIQSRSISEKRQNGSE